MSSENVSSLRSCEETGSAGGGEWQRRKGAVSLMLELHAACLGAELLGCLFSGNREHGV